MAARDKTPTMFDVEGKEPAKEKKPTLSQWLKEHATKIEYPHYSTVELIWFPGKWSNYSFQTTDFRVSISERNPLYTPVDKGIMRFRDEGVGLLIRVIDRDGAIGLAQSTVYGTWETIGNAGLRFTGVE